MRYTIEMASCGIHSAYIQSFMKIVRFEVSTAVTMMIIIFWEMTPCGSYKNRRFGGS
jgi:hypothetical protein